MMHEREKSDTAVVAVKPTNKAGASIATAAEPVEPRAGTKRNAGEQSTHRTLSRVRVTQALDRVRQAARQRKKEKFTALFHHLSIDLLWEAFLALKRDAAPGVDDLTWHLPVYPGDTLTATSTVHSSRLSKKDPSQAICTWHTKGFNQHGQMVVDFKRTNLILKRPAE